MSDCARPLLPSRHGAVGDGPLQVQAPPPPPPHVNIAGNNKKDFVSILLNKDKMWNISNVLADSHEMTSQKNSKKANILENYPLKE